MDLGDRHEPGRVGGVDHVAGIDLAQADPPLDRRGDGTVAEVQPGRRDRRIVAGDHGGQAVDHRLLGIDLLVRGEAALRQRRIPRQVALRVVQVGFVLGALRDGGVQRGLERARIDHRQHVALLHLLALGDRHLHQRAIDAAAHLHGVECLHRSKAAEIQRDILTDTAGDGHRNGSGWALRARLLCARPIGQAESEARRRQPAGSQIRLPASGPLAGGRPGRQP